MKNSLLYLLGIAMACLALAWTWSQCNASYQSALQASLQQQQCSQTIAQIKTLQSNTQASTQIAAKDFDPGQTVTAAARSSKFPVANFSVNQSRAKKVDRTNIRKWQVQVPTVSLPLTSALQFVRKLASGDVQFQVERLDLRPDPKSSDSTEHWKADFSIFYLKRDDL